MKKSVSIIGGGPASFLLAAFLDPTKFDVSIYEKNKSLGRKFLVAGKGGFNLTHSEPIAQLTERYSPPHFLKESLIDFDNIDFRNWLNSIGIPTFIGSSKRVYPERGIKPIAVLNAIQNTLVKQGVKIKKEYTWRGWKDNNILLFNNDLEIKTDLTVFSLGGGSWKVTGSDGSWLNTFKEQGIKTKTFEASNCAYGVNWQKDFINKNEGVPLKNIAITCSNKIQKGEVVITRFGIEGNAIYALSPHIRKELKANKKAIINIDFKPNTSLEDLTGKIEKSTLRTPTEILRKAIKLNEAQIDLIKTYVSKEDFLNPKLLSENIKNLKIEITKASVIDEAISTVGGIDLNAIDNHFQLKALKNNYCIGEMLDWDAPTGGYLLQACASMGVHLAKHLNETY